MFRHQPNTRAESGHTRRVAKYHGLSSPAGFAWKTRMLATPLWGTKHVGSRECGFRRHG